MSILRKTFYQSSVYTTTNDSNTRKARSTIFQILFYQPYCAFHKHANSKVQKPPSQLRFSLPSIIITITSNEPGNTETQKSDRNPPITNHKPWPFEPVKVKFCFLRGPLRWLTVAKNAIVSWLLNFRIRMFVKSAVITDHLTPLWLYFRPNIRQLDLSLYHSENSIKMVHSPIRNLK